MDGELTTVVYRLGTETENLRRPSVGNQSNRRTMKLINGGPSAQPFRWILSAV